MQISSYAFFFLVNVHIPKDRITQAHQGYGFIEFLNEEDADYAMKIMNMIKLYGKPIRVNKVKTDKQNVYTDSGHTYLTVGQIEVSGHTQRHREVD